MSLVRRYTAFQVCFSLLLWLPIFYDYQRRAGLSDAEIFGIQSIYYLVFCGLEIPTGVLADIKSPRFCLRLAGLVLTAANLLPALVPTYSGFLAHFLLVALARSLASGASSAYLYDGLRAQGAADRYKAIEGRARSLGLVLKLGGWACMGFLTLWHPSAPYWLTSIASCASFLVALALPAVESRTESVASGILALFRPAWRLVTTSRALTFVMLQGIGIFVLERIVSVNLFQPVLAARGFPVAGYGLVMSAMTAFEAVGAASPGQIRRFFSDRASVSFLTLVMSVSVAALALHSAEVAVAGLCLFSLGCGMAFPIQRQLMNDAIPGSHYRATLLSMESLVDRAVCAIVAGSLAGFLAAGRMDGFLIGAGVGFGGLILVLRFLAARPKLL
jgi:MFS family permease